MGLGVSFVLPEEVGFSERLWPREFLLDHRFTSFGTDLTIGSVPDRPFVLKSVGGSGREFYVR